jgi:hypothetical protein
MAESTEGPREQEPAGRWVVDDGPTIWWEFGTGEAMEPEQALRNHVDNQQFEAAYDALAALSTRPPAPTRDRVRGQVNEALRDAGEPFSFRQVNHVANAVMLLVAGEPKYKVATSDERSPTICLSCLESIPFAEYVDHRRGCQDDIAESNAQLVICACGHTAEAHSSETGACTSWRPAREHWCPCKGFTTDAPEEPEVVHIAIDICRPCLAGEGEECHTPGCALWMHRVDLPIDPVWYEVLTAGGGS